MRAIPHAVVLTLLLGAIAGPARAEEILVTLRYLGPDGASSFNPLLRVEVHNESFMTVPLAEKIAASQLLVDGRPYPRGEAPFQGPAGLSPRSAWEGCLRLEDYVPAGLPSGHYRLQLKIGDHLSKKVRVGVEKSEPPAATPEQRRKQAESLADTLSAGLMKSCVELWLTEKDGGLQTLDQTHYYVDPGVKVIVPYADAQPEPRIKGPARVYNETRIAD